MQKGHDEKTLRQLENLGKRIRKLRIEKGYSNAEIFAYENDISRTQYARYEKGEDLQFTSLLKVLNGLDISLKDFFSEGFEN